MFTLRVPLEVWPTPMLLVKVVVLKGTSSECHTTSPPRRGEFVASCASSKSPSPPFPARARHHSSQGVTLKPSHGVPAWFWQLLLALAMA
ncbi:hypothetical protein LY76DRAFT_591440 [Colletotrichum caudatum]|nr:hypothetical protein LY76DRAFT_591440 [Colletotrichum caudatum]